jgi:hypothetical protein
MNEASSKYVDQIAVDKLLSEKLNKVHHYPKELKNDNIHISDIKKINLDEIVYHSETINGSSQILFNSALSSGYAENDIVRCINYKSQDSVIKGNLIFIHGLYEDNLQIYNFFISLLNDKGINVILMMLPFHYDRRPGSSLFSGEYFWSGDIDRNVLAFKQSIFDLYMTYRIVKNENYGKVILSGFSMGGGIALTLASKLELDGIFAINPVSNITSLVWNSKLFSPVKKDFEYSGLDYTSVKQRFEEFEPLDIVKVATPMNKIALGSSIYDQINDPDNYELLIKKWNLNNVFKYKAGHLNILRVPKLANDIDETFFKTEK